MSGMLILSYRHKEVTNSDVLYCFLVLKNVYISTTICLIEMEFDQNVSFSKGEMICIEKLKFNIFDM